MNSSDERIEPEYVAEDYDEVRKLIESAQAARWAHDAAWRWLPAAWLVAALVGLWWVMR